MLLEIKSPCLPRLAWTLILVFYTTHHSWDDTTTHSFFFLSDEVLQTILPGLAWNHDPLDVILSLQCNLGWQSWTTVSRYWLRLDLVNYLPRLASVIFLISASQAAGITSVSHGFLIASYLAWTVERKGKSYNTSQSHPSSSLSLF
jgi:hypothetical protein